MHTYAPLWSSVVDSSLWLEPDFVVKVFLTMIAKKDADHVVRGTAFNIAQWAKKTEKEVIDALKILAAPDTRRIEPQEFDGRRIEKVEDGWLILNGQKYREWATKAARRAYQAQWVSEKRNRDKEAPERFRKRKRTPAEIAGANAYDNGEEELGDEIAARGT